MGSIGISTGRLMGRQVDQVLGGAEGERGFGTATYFGTIPGRITIDNEDGTGSFSIDMGGATQEQRRAFLRAWRGRSNVDNSQRAYDRAYREALGGGATESEATRLANEARTSATRFAMNKLLMRQRERFAGIRTVNRRQRRG